jgi:hypothetical protein
MITERPTIKLFLTTFELCFERAVPSSSLRVQTVHKRARAILISGCGFWFKNFRALCAQSPLLLTPSILKSWLRPCKYWHTRHCLWQCNKICILWVRPLICYVNNRTIHACRGWVHSTIIENIAYMHVHVDTQLLICLTLFLFPIQKLKHFSPPSTTRLSVRQHSYH